MNKPILILGAVMPDILLREGVEIGRNVGGCACNVADTLRHFAIPYTLFAPIGTGENGDFVRARLAERRMASPLSVPGKHGCCRCYLGPEGPSYGSDRLAEYDFTPELLDTVEPGAYSMVYMAGLELRERCGDLLADWLTRAGIPLFFAPGPHLMMTRPERVDRIFALKPQIHLNDQEVCRFTGVPTPEQGADALFARTGQPVWVTCGPRGSLCRDRDGFHHVPAPEVPSITDTIGAGDSHAGAVLAGLWHGLNADRCLALGSRLSGALVRNRGSLLPDDIFESVFPQGTEKEFLL